jgi:nucleotide-binding universal stress UspA family protein
VAVADISVPVDIGLMPPVALTDNCDWLRGLADESIEALRSAGLETEFVSEFGNPKSVLVDIAENWHADSIFVGANRFGSRVERFLLGSVSAAVAARAHCSVEVVRTGDPPA